jgi:cytochrome c
MRGKGAHLILSVSALSVVVSAHGAAWSAERMDGKALYLANCSNCHGVVTAGGRGRRDSTPIPVAVQLAVALPYGPTLNGVLGRTAGTVPGYEYSRAFLAALRGVVWTRAALDRWISDTRAWAPGAIMVYRQPDPAIRARIIDYLEHPRANPASRDTMPTQGGEIDGHLSMMSSAIRR